jgi:hypothetical protein
MHAMSARKVVITQMGQTWSLDNTSASALYADVVSLRRSERDYER